MTDPAQPGDRTEWRLLVHGPGDGAWNMAVDEALLAGYAGDPSPRAPTLRLYSWEPHALSLGKAQESRTAHDPAFLREQGIDLVRRPTGGRAVLHARECTYAVIGRLGSGGFSRGVLDTYRRVAGGLECGLRLLGVAARSEPHGARAPAGDETAREADCFATTSAHEITVTGRKLVGSAQLRRRDAFLQHGSIPLRSDAARLRRALGRAARPARDSTDLETALGRLPAEAEVARALVRGFEIAFRAELRRSELCETEALRAQRLRCWKYDSASWTLEGRLGARERRWGPGEWEPALRPPASSTR